MTKRILITGATDGIGLETARALLAQGHDVILHGRNASKLTAVQAEIGASHAPLICDLSDLTAVKQMAQDLAEQGTTLDVLINNAGVFRTSATRTNAGLDVRFAVNTFAPYILALGLRELLGSQGRVVNLSSAAQAPLDLAAMAGQRDLDDMAAYAQSKLALTMWTAHLARQLEGGPSLVSVNPGSLLATKMVKKGFGVAGSDVQIGVDILCRAALSDEFSDPKGRYFDNDSGAFAPPHSAGRDPGDCAAVAAEMDAVISRLA